MVDFYAVSVGGGADISSLPGDIAKKVGTAQIVLGVTRNDEYPTSTPSPTPATHP